MSPRSESDDHYVVQATNMPPTELICKCGARYVGADCLDKMERHIAQVEPKEPGQ